MITSVKVCNPATEEPFRSFVEDTTTVVCVPEHGGCQLYVQAEQPGQLTIEVDGEEIHSCPVAPPSMSISLADILRPEPSRPAVDSLLFALTSKLARRPKRIDRFTAIISLNEQASRTVAGTFNIRLCNPTDFELAFTRHLKAGRQPDSRLAAEEAEADSDQKNCWNCNQPITSSVCPHCEAEQE